MNPMWAEMGKNVDMFRKTCVNCERNLEDLIGEQWCTKHDIDRLPIFGCGYWRVRPDLGSVVEFAKKRKLPVDGAQTENTDKEVRGWRWRITKCQ